MRLKFIFFPIILVVSLVVFINNIWPQIGEIKKINEEKIVKKQQLLDIAAKQAAIDLVGKKITDNDGGEGMVKNYLPEKKVEEQIINGINYLAGDANLSLTNVTLDSAEKQQVAAALGDIDPVTGQPLPSKPTNVVKNMSAKISVSGEYGKIRIFLDGLAHMPIFNSIKSVNITKQAPEKKEGEVADENILVANIMADFGYMDMAKTDALSLGSFKQDLDIETINALNKYVSQKVQPLENGGDAKGKPNPFVAN